MKHLQNITSNTGLNNYRPLVAYDAEGDRSYYLPFENLPPFTITAVSDITVSMSRNPIKYSLDGIQWQDLSVGSSFSASAGDKIYIQCSSPSVSSGYGMGTFSIEGTFSVAGNIMSLVNGDNYNTDYTHKAYQFKALLRSNTGLLDASELILPATTLESNCYASMFYNCTNLVNAPELPATALADQCYDQMFGLCTSLVNAPELPATTLAHTCYSWMFDSCTSLVNAPVLPATTLEYSCYSYMFHDCTALVNAPELPAMVLAQACYQEMFEGCTSLSYIKALFLTKPSTSYTADWVSGVPSAGTFVKNAEATWDVVGLNGVPSGWTVETANE